MRTKRLGALAMIAALSLGATMAGEERAEKSQDENRTPQIKCKLRYDLKGWSVFYKSGRGSGDVTCDNGETAKVSIRTHAGGLTFGKSEIVNGHGSFTKVKDITEIYGSYALAEAHGGAAKSGGAQALTKGNVSLSIAGSGHGVDLGLAVGKFTIRPLDEQEASAGLRASSGSVSTDGD